MKTVFALFALLAVARAVPIENELATEDSTDWPWTSTASPRPAVHSSCRCVLQPLSSFFDQNSKLYVDELMSHMSPTGYTSDTFECDKTGVTACQKSCATQVSSLTNGFDIKFEVVPGKTIAQAVCEKNPTIFWPTRLLVSGEMHCVQGTSTHTSSSFTNEFGSQRTFKCLRGKPRLFPFFKLTSDRPH